MTAPIAALGVPPEARAELPAAVPARACVESLPDVPPESRVGSRLDVSPEARARPLRRPKPSDGTRLFAAAVLALCAACGESGRDGDASDAEAGDADAAGETDAEDPGDGDPGAADSGAAAGPTRCDDWQPAFDATEFGAFMSVWGRGPDDVWTVGGQPDFGGSVPEGVAFHWDGTAWERVALPEGGMLNWVHGTADSTWIAGEGGRVLRIDAAGQVTAWNDLVDADLWGLWASADDDVWTVGGRPRDREGVPIMLHFDGTDWTSVELPATDDVGARSLFKIWRADTGELFAVGARGVVLANTGDGWQRQDSGVGDDLISVWGRSATDVAIAGGRSQGLVGRFDGTDWTFQEPERVTGLNGVWMAADGTVFVDGANGRVLRAAAGEADFERIDTPTSELLHGFWAVDGGPCFAVGGSLLAPPPYVGVVLRAD